MSEIIDPGKPGITILNQTQDGLLDRDPSYRELIPGIAVGMPENPDPLTYVFKVRSGVKFNTGDPVTAADVKFTYERLIDTKYKASFGQVYRDNIDRIEVSGDTVTFKMKQPWPIFLSFVGGNHPKIGQKKVVDDPQYGNSVWSGTGPFNVQEWVKGDHVTIVKASNNSPRGSAYLDKVIYKTIVEDSTRLAALQTGQADVLMDPPFKDIARFAKDPQYKVAKTTGSATTIMFLNTALKPLDQKDVRKALSLGIDRKALVDAFFYGYADVAGDLFPPDHWAHDPSVTQPFDPKAARDLLSAAGYSSANPLKFALMVDTQSIYTDQATMMQAQLKDIGVQMEIKPIEYTTLSAIYKKKPQEWVGQAGLSRITPLRGTAFEFSYYQYGAKGALNFTSFNMPGGLQRPDIEDAMNRALELSDFSEKDRTKAKPLWAEISKKMNDDPVQLRLNFWNTVNIMSTKVQDWTVANGDTNDLTKTWLKT